VPALSDGGQASAEGATCTDRARELALEAAVREGFDMSAYHESGCDLDESRQQYVVTFTSGPPTPPGGEFDVWVDVRTGRTELLRGE